MGPADQDVTQRLTARFGVVYVVKRARHVAIGCLGDGVDDVHGLFAPTRGRHRRSAVGVLLQVPLGKGFVVAAFTRVEYPGSGHFNHVSTVTSDRLSNVIALVMSSLTNR